MMNRGDITMTNIRNETDSLGVVEVPADKLWGAQTQRSLEPYLMQRMLVSIARGEGPDGVTGAHLRRAVEPLHAPPAGGRGENEAEWTLAARSERTPRECA